jgi:hypothetical protein
LFPISRLAFVVGNGDHADHVRIVKINDRERKTVEKKPASSIQVFRPALGRVANVFNSSGDLGDKGIGGVWLRSEYQASAASMSSQANG